jgi:D-tyrosyl-tRNA(Tyr) deacylase
VIVAIQRVSRAEVRVAGTVVGKIGRGLVLLVGVERGDGEADAEVLARKIAALRIFPGSNPMDLALRDVGGACLVVSQFTLVGSLHKGNRPGFDRAEDPPRARALYELFADKLRAEAVPVETGQFAADMEVELVNDGPVTFVLEARAGALVKDARQ